MSVTEMESRPPLTRLQRLILDYVKGRSASYTQPVPSSEIALALRISWTYAREQAHELVKRGMLEVRVGPGGGYYPAPAPPAACVADPAGSRQAPEGPPAEGPARPGEGESGGEGPSRAGASSGLPGDGPDELVAALRQVATELSELASILGGTPVSLAAASRRSPEAVRLQAEEVLEALRRLRQATRAVRGSGAVAVMSTRW